MLRKESIYKGRAGYLYGSEEHKLTLNRVGFGTIR